MQSSHQEQIDSRSEPSPMAIVGAILALGAIRWMDRQKSEQLVAKNYQATVHGPKDNYRYSS